MSTGRYPTSLVFGSQAGIFLAVEVFIYGFGVLMSICYPVRV